MTGLSSWFDLNFHQNNLRVCFKLFFTRLWVWLPQDVNPEIIVFGIWNLLVKQICPYSLQICSLEIDLTTSTKKNFRKKPNSLQELPWDTQCGEIIFEESFLCKYLKLRYCEKASNLFWRLLCSFKTSGIFFQIFVDFLENLNFNNKNAPLEFISIQYCSMRYIVWDSRKFLVCLKVPSAAPHEDRDVGNRGGGHRP